MFVRQVCHEYKQSCVKCRDYLTELRDYLLGFQQRTQPLVDVAGQLQKTREAFAQEWEAGTVPGWADRGAAEVPAEAAAGKLDVDAFDSVEELETIGPLLQRPLPTLQALLSPSDQTCF